MDRVHSPLPKRSADYSSGMSRPHQRSFPLAIATFGCILASQTLCDMPGWSRLGFAFGALLAIMLGVGIVLGVYRLHLGEWIWAPGAFLLYCLLRVLPDFENQASLDTLFSVFSAFLIGTSVALALQAGVDFKVLVYGQIVANLCNIGAGFCGIGNEALPGETVARYAGLTGNANEFALQLTLGACIVWLFPGKSGRLACAFSFVAVGYALLTTGSRKALLALPIFLLLVLAQAIAAARQRRTYFSLLILVIPCVVLVGFILLTGDRLTNIAVVQRTLEYQDSSFDTRMGMAQQGIRLWKQAPVFGHGLNAFQRISDFKGYAHNNYAELLCDLGLVGALLFYAIHVHILARSLRLPNELRLVWWTAIILVLTLDVGCVSYLRKQTIMLLMILLTMPGYQPVVSSKTAGLRVSRRWPRARTLRGARPVSPYARSVEVKGL
jgi:O-antigen ligase